MKSTLVWTLPAIVALGGIAQAETTIDAGTTETLIRVSGSHRGVAQDYMVLPSGGELTGQMKFVLAQPVFGPEPVRFSDLALFSLAGRWSLHPKLELSGHVDFLPKQPSFTDEKPWQSVGLGLRTPLGKRVALALSGSGGHLIDHSGMWTSQAVTLQWRKPIARVMTFDVAGGVSGVSLSARDTKSAFVTEVGVSTTALFREPSGHWGSWVGIGYALPVYSRGSDPTTTLSVDPQPRLDFKIGTVLSLVKEWDLFAEYAIIDRGDLQDPATRLPILDGGFDQHQVLFGVTRHITVKKRQAYDDDRPLQIGSM